LASSLSQVVAEGLGVDDDGEGSGRRRRKRLLFFFLFVAVSFSIFAATAADERPAGEPKKRSGGQQRRRRRARAPVRSVFGRLAVSRVRQELPPRSARGEGEGGVARRRSRKERGLTA